MAFLKFVDGFKLQEAGDKDRLIYVVDYMIEKKKLARLAFWRSTGSTGKAGRWGLFLPVHYPSDSGALHWWAYKNYARADHGGVAVTEAIDRDARPTVVARMNIKLSNELQDKLNRITEDVEQHGDNLIPRLNRVQMRDKLLTHGIGVWTGRRLAERTEHIRLCDLYDALSPVEARAFLSNAPIRHFQDMDDITHSLYVKTHPHMQGQTIPLVFHPSTGNGITLSSRPGLGHYVTSEGDAIAKIELDRTFRPYVKAVRGEVKIKLPGKEVILKPKLLSRTKMYLAPGMEFEINGAQYEYKPLKYARNR